MGVGKIRVDPMKVEAGDHQIDALRRDGQALLIQTR